MAAKYGHYYATKVSIKDGDKPILKNIKLGYTGTRDYGADIDISVYDFGADGLSKILNINFAYGNGHGCSGYYNLKNNVYEALYRYFTLPLTITDCYAKFDSISQEGKMMIYSW